MKFRPKGFRIFVFCNNRTTILYKYTNVLTANGSLPIQGTFSITLTITRAQNVM